MKGNFLVKMENDCKELQNFNQVSSDLLAKRQMKCEEIHKVKNNNNKKKNLRVTWALTGSFLLRIIILS